MMSQTKRGEDDIIQNRGVVPGFELPKELLIDNDKLRRKWTTQDDAMAKALMGDQSPQEFFEQKKAEWATQDILHNNNQTWTLVYTQILGEDAYSYDNRGYWFQQRFNLVKEAVVYKFKDDFVKLLAESNKNDIGYRHMPFDNIYIECFIQLPDGVWINGIHVCKVKWTPDGNEAVQLKGYPEINGDEGIAIYCVGGDGKGAQFFNHLSLAKNNPYDKMRTNTGASCPHCGTPLQKMTNHLWYCDKCKNKGGDILTFNIDHPLVKKDLKKNSVMKDIWKHDDEVRLFVTNFLDFITNPEVEVRPTFDRKTLEERNKKRARRGKKPFVPINIVRVTGHLYKYVSALQDRYSERKYIAHEHIVKGHWMRFWNAEHYTQIYSFLKGARSDEEREKRLRKVLRRNEDGHVLPASQQYIWDREYQVIKVWKLPFVRNEGAGFNDKERVNLVEVKK